MQSSSNLDNKATTNVIFRDFEMNHSSTISATTAETKKDGLNALKKTNHPTRRSSCKTARSDSPSSTTMTSVKDEVSSENEPTDLTFLREADLYCFKVSKVTICFMPTLVVLETR